MASLLTVQVQNQLHDVVRTYTEPESEPFLRFCRRAEAEGVRYVEFIWPYQDAMLNEFQLNAWLLDLPKALSNLDLATDERLSVEAMLEAVREAQALAGYLLIEG